MTLSIIVPTHNGGDDFRRCLEGIEALDPPPDEVIVVPDGESDGSWRLALGRGMRVLDPGDRSRGPAFARNRGAEVATSDLLFFLDTDVIVHPNALREIEAAYADAPELDAVIGSYDDAPGHPSFLSQYRNLLHHHTHQTAEEESSTFWGACGVIRRAAYLSVGGFDADRFALPSVEDIELGYRLKQAGYTIHLRKSLLVTHLKRWDARSILRTDFFQRALPWTALLLEYSQIENNLNLRTESRLSVIAAGLLVVSLALAIVIPAAGFVALASVLALLVLNASLYRFFLTTQGLWFTLRVLPCHWLYFVYGGVAFAIGLARHYVLPKARRKAVSETL